MMCEKLWIWGNVTFIELEQLKCAPSTPALLFCEPVIGISLILGRLAHCDDDVVYLLWRNLSKVEIPCK